MRSCRERVSKIFVSKHRLRQIVCISCRAQTLPLSFWKEPTVRCPCSRHQILSLRSASIRYRSNTLRRLLLLCRAIPGCCGQHHQRGAALRRCKRVRLPQRPPLSAYRFLVERLSVCNENHRRKRRSCWQRFRLQPAEVDRRRFFRLRQSRIEWRRWHLIRLCLSRRKVCRLRPLQMLSSHLRAIVVKFPCAQTEPPSKRGLCAIDHRLRECSLPILGSNDPVRQPSLPARSFRISRDRREIRLA